MATRQTDGLYESAENILHLWFPRHVALTDEAKVHEFFEEVLVEWIQRCPTRPYLLVNFANLSIGSNMTNAYAKEIQRFQSLVLGTFRYGMPPDFTGVAVAIGNMQVASPANIFPDEASARDAIRRARRGK